MKRLDRWLLPVLTCLVVLVAILLPQRLSQWRDQAALNGLHTEELKTENELPTQSLTLEERILLLARYDEDMDSMTAMVQELEQSGEVAGMMRKELERLCESGVLPPEVLPADLSSFESRRLYLRAPEEIWGSSFLLMEGYDKAEDIYFSLVLDEETGYALRLELATPALQQFSDEPVNIGITFLDRLGVENMCIGYGGYDATFDLPGADCRYTIWLENHAMLQITPAPKGIADFATDASSNMAAR